MALSYWLDDKKDIWPTKKPVSFIPKGSLLEQMQEETEEKLAKPMFTLISAFKFMGNVVMAVLW